VFLAIFLTFFGLSTIGTIIESSTIGDKPELKEPEKAELLY
jgi:hypothetical protein